ncbi:unnamed protein product [Chondrus crispus]|uniref:Uncharacterized protein n=1 Tax=Chondrus crispus TaxID=2769 RepID=R7Q617_CHOCR|nr:unnamed protein product [Chondrus crispus]CDF33454.1 unnamed protein product [Chondrus crispus]|eukprot:XP_005713257.1 unnamed protein product [Chondrus crispus]
MISFRASLTWHFMFASPIFIRHLCCQACKMDFTPLFWGLCAVCTLLHYSDPLRYSDRYAFFGSPPLGVTVSMFISVAVG